LKEIALGAVHSGKDAVKLILQTGVGGALSEMITQPAQTFIQETGAEKAGLQAPTTLAQKAKKAAYETALAGTQGAVFGGAGATLGVHQAGQAQAARVEAVKSLIERMRAEQGKPYAEGGKIAPVTGTTAPSTGLFPGPPTAPAAPLTERFNALDKDARARVQALPLMKWDGAIAQEQKAAEAEKATESTPTTAPEDVATQGPTTDEELEKMKADYLGGPKAASAFAASLGARTPEEERQVLTEALPHFARLHVELANAGINAVFRNGGKAGLADVNDQGVPTVYIDRGGLMDLVRGGAISPGGEIKLLGSEEFSHVADHLAWAKKWKTENPGATGGFKDWMRGQLTTEYGDLKNTVLSAPAADQKVLLEGLRDVYHTYFGDFKAEEKGAAPADATIFDRITNNQNAGDYRFMMEFARMVVQQKNQGAISESTYRSTLHTISDFFDRVLQRVKDVFPKAEQGQYGTLFQGHIERLQSQIDEINAQAKLKGKPQPFGRLSPEDLAKLQGPQRPGGYAPQPAPKKSLAQAMQEKFGFAKAPSPGGKLTPEEKKARLQSQGLGAREGEAPGKAGLLERMKRLGILPGRGVEFRPAVQVGGKVYEGASHFDAVRNARKSGLTNEEILRGTVGNLDENDTFRAFGERQQGLHKETSERALGLALREGPATVNIGLNTDDGKGISLEEVLKALDDTGVKVKGYRVEPSATEPTVVAYLDKTLEPDEAHELSRILKQQAIAEKFPGGAELYGPGAEAWRPFNEDFFLSSRAPAPELARSLDELEYLAGSYEKYKAWYQEFDKFLDSILGANSEYKPLITDFIAATSLMTGIGKNVRQATDKLREYVETGQLTHSGMNFASSKLPNLRWAVEGSKLSGPKVDPFSEALKGDPNATAVDRHVAMILFNTKAPTAAMHKVGHQVAVDIAQRIGWTPAQVQAAWWAAGKELYGERGKIVETYEQFLKEYQDELNAILTKDREGEARGLRAARAISSRVGEDRRCGGVVGSLGAGQARKPKGSRETEVDEVKRREDISSLQTAGSTTSAIATTSTPITDMPVNSWA
jgi:hypothetical protein